MENHIIQGMTTANNNYEIVSILSSNTSELRYNSSDPNNVSISYSSSKKNSTSSKENLSINGL